MFDCFIRCPLSSLDVFCRKLHPCTADQNVTPPTIATEQYRAISSAQGAVGIIKSPDAPNHGPLDAPHHGPLLSAAFTFSCILARA